jgi:hypothetical protein
MMAVASLTVKPVFGCVQHQCRIQHSETECRKYLNKNRAAEPSGMVCVAVKQSLSWLLPQKCHPLNVGCIVKQSAATCAFMAKQEIRQKLTDLRQPFFLSCGK